MINDQANQPFFLKILILLKVFKLNTSEGNIQLLFDLNYYQDVSDFVV
jgi:hypothetical protein